MIKKRLYEILSAEPYERHHQILVTDDKEWADWWVNEVNKCVNRYESYYVNEYYYPPVCRSYGRVLYILFTFDLNDDNIFSSDIACSDHEIEEWESCNSYIDFLGKGESYEECEKDATKQFNKWRKK